MTRALTIALAAAVALAGWVVWVLAHAPDDGECCDLCGTTICTKKVTP